MKFYSEKLKQMFNTEEECLKAEQELEKQNLEVAKQKAEKAEAAKKVEEAYDAYIKAGKEYSRLLNDFINKYHYYHQTLKGDEDGDKISLFDLFLKDWLI